MDESDLYIKQIKHKSLYEKANECVHVTATPFLQMYNNYFDNVILKKNMDRTTGDWNLASGMPVNCVDETNFFTVPSFFGSII